MTSWICLAVSEVKSILHWAPRSVILSKFLLRWFAEVRISYITDKKDVSSEKSFGLDERPSLRSLM